MSVTSLNALMTPVTDCLDVPSLEALVKLRASPEAQARMDWLAAQAREGLLSTEEKAEYESCVMFGNFLGILQSKAQKKLNAAA